MSVAHASGQPRRAATLPVPGPVWGARPQRPAERPLLAPWPGARALGAVRLRRTVRAARHFADAWHAVDPAARVAALPALRQALRRHGLQGSHRPDDPLAQALGLVAACAAHTLGWVPRDTQLRAAAAMLDGCMAEMATGEGKTLALALAAGVAALAGVPVHLITANPYLAARDAQRLAPLYHALGLRVAALAPQDSDAQRRAAYAADIVHATAKDFAFDHLRDRQGAGAQTPLEQAAAALAGRPAAPPLLRRGLCLALIDEADSVLLDEAEVPLILSRAVPQPARRAALWQALAIARQLRAPQEFELHAAERRITLTAAGEDRIAELAAPLGPAWQRVRQRRERVRTALSALHAQQRDAHYVMRDGRIELLDEVTGRVASGRVWSQGLHTAVALKEGLDAGSESQTVAQITFQRFFQRYWRLAGISGTLREARGELLRTYGTPVVRIALHEASRAQALPARGFADRDAMLDAAVTRVRALRDVGRPVLVGTDSVAESQALSARLTAAAIAHHVLDALHDTDEAAVVAAAGRAGQVTVATRMAGRGTDIELDAAARAAGGLHVIVCQDNPSRRLDRQLVGRAARRGDPGSHEQWLFPCHPSFSPATALGNLPPWQRPQLSVFSSLSMRLACARHRWQQWREEQRRAALREALLEQDLQWERRLAFAGRAD